MNERVERLQKKMQEEGLGSLCHFWITALWNILSDVVFPAVSG